MKNPSLKKKVVTDFGDQRSNQGDKSSEILLLTRLSHAHTNNKNFKAAIGFIQNVKQYLSKEDVDGISKNIELEAFRNINLGMDDAAQNGLWYCHLCTFIQTPTSNIMNVQSLPFTSTSHKTSIPGDLTTSNET